MGADRAEIQSDFDSSAFKSTSTVPFWLDGKQVTTATTFPVVSPLDHQVLYQCSSANTKDVDNAIASAANAFQSWSKTRPNERRDVFLRAAEEFKRRKDEQYHYSYSETGSPKAMFEFEHYLAYEACKYVAGLLPTALTGTTPIVDEGKSAMVFKEPYGVVLGIAPWNAPNVLGLRACLQPLAM